MTEESTNKASKNFWDGTYDNIELKIASEDFLLRTWIEEYFPKLENNSKKSCFEIGCCPGQYLAVFGELGYELNGIDFSDNINTVSNWMKEQGYRTGNFYNQDFLKFDTADQYDIVLSLGFIEHFTNWDEILMKHLSLVKQNGYLVIEAPNFIYGFQNWLHKNLDKESYKRHYTPAMDIEKWAVILERNNFEIIFKGYFGKFDYWLNYEKRTFINNLFLMALRKMYPLLSNILPKDKKFYSPVGGIIALKN
jgi:L-malate glycosyltransferase